MPIRRILSASVNEVRYESLRMIRSPGFSIPFLLLPVPVYLFFGVMLAAPAVAKHPAVANYLFSGFAVFAVMGPALFGVGCVLAVEREAGFLKLKRALPAPGGAHVIAKAAMAMVFAGLAMITVLVAGIGPGKVTLSASQLLIMTAVMTVGALPFAAIGLFIGAHASANVAPEVANIVFLPMLWLSGLFIPLPKFLERWAVIWPGVSSEPARPWIGRRFRIQLPGAGNLGRGTGGVHRDLRRPRDSPARAEGLMEKRRASQSAQIQRPLVVRQRQIVFEEGPIVGQDRTVADEPAQIVRRCHVVSEQALRVAKARSRERRLQRGHGEPPGKFRRLDFQPADRPDEQRTVDPDARLGKHVLERTGNELVMRP